MMRLNLRLPKSLRGREMFLSPSSNRYLPLAHRPPHSSAAKLRPPTLSPSSRRYSDDGRSPDAHLTFRARTCAYSLDRTPDEVEPLSQLGLARVLCQS